MYQGLIRPGNFSNIFSSFLFLLAFSYHIPKIFLVRALTLLSFVYYLVSLYTRYQFSFRFRVQECGGTNTLGTYW